MLISIIIIVSHYNCNDDAAGGHGRAADSGAVSWDGDHASEWVIAGFVAVVYATTAVEVAAAAGEDAEDASVERRRGGGEGGV